MNAVQNRIPASTKSFRRLYKKLTRLRTKFKIREAFPVKILELDKTMVDSMEKKEGHVNVDCYSNYRILVYK